MAKKNYEIDIDLGLIPITINFTGGKEPTEILLNPADIDICKRLFEAQKRIEEKAEQMKNVELDENGIPLADEYIEKATQLNNTVYEAIDYAFNSNISEKVFKYCSPFALVNGQIFVTQFIDKITPFIADIMEKERKKTEEKTKKYLGKYMK